ncbi:MAG TPA: FMN-binding protein [Trebonia sp.]|nr:FMN-binding protein [Trebonia sp.]
MRRAILTLGGTAAGLAALFSFKTHSLAGTAALGAPTAPGTSSAAPMGGDGSMKSTAASGEGSAMGTSKSTSKKTGMGSGSGKMTSTGTMATKRTLTGAVENTQYGPMQVQVTMTGTKITEITVLQHTDDGETSAQIDSAALPKLTAEALAAQSARIDAVSGASYTSSGYIQSLQSALDKA